MPKKQKKQMVHAEGDICFWVSNGAILANLNELYEALMNMDDETFAHHVNNDKNDFAKWVDEALKDPELGKKLMKCKTTAAMLKVVGTHLKNNYII
jgi:hypothetical protein